MAACPRAEAVGVVAAGAVITAEVVAADTVVVTGEVVAGSEVALLLGEDTATEVIWAVEAEDKAK